MNLILILTINTTLPPSDVLKYKTNFFDSPL